ncbi:hypothetical protein [Lactobacillus sp. LL6]|uniref:hypothetical protein n=1 Tax=Lactobacillus sp. LL6 TaxID=2596827 RepID=UPI001186B5A7|nr:hypothetical protein [Lactobacillus sp. LL6]TSO26695.1 hypothetical protein FOD82_06435 [Lactobacillus sp. LL6]
MKNKIIAIISLILFFGVGVVFVKKYTEVNANNIKVTEKVIHKNQLIHAHNINFKVLNTSVQKNNDEIELRVKMYLHQYGKLDFGQKTNNPNYIENMWLEVPYSLSNPVVKVYDKNDKDVTYLKKLLHAKQPVTVVATLPNKEYYSAEKKPRFTFIVPNGKNYTKYSLLLSR